MYEPQYEPQQEYYTGEPAATPEMTAAYLSRVMGWMCVGLLTTAVTALLVYSVPLLLYYVVATPLFYGILIAQLGVVIAMSAAIRKMSAPVATVMFLFYSGLTGVTLSIFLLLYDFVSLMSVFVLTAAIFFGMALYGYLTKRDLTRIGSLCLFGLIGIIIGGAVNLFLGNGMIEMLVTCVGILLFIGLTAYDTQRIKALYVGALEQGYTEDSPQVRKMAIFGALTLYLDFINLFLKLVRLFGRRK